MARFLFTVWPIPGHLHFNITIAHALQQQGHEVRFYTGGMARNTIEGEGFPLSPFRHVDEQAVLETIMSPRGIQGHRRQPWRLQALWRQVLTGTVPGQLADLEEIQAGWPADVIVSDPLMWGPILVLHERDRIPVAIMSYTASCMLPGRDGPLLGVSLPRPHSVLGRVRYELARAVVRLLTLGARRDANRLRARHGLAPLRETVAAYTGRMPLHLVPSTPAFDYYRTDLPPSVHYIGPCVRSRPPHEAPTPWVDELPTDRPVVYVTEGTIHGVTPVVLQSAARGLADVPVSVVMTTGGHRDPVELGLAHTAPNIRVERWAWPDDLLPRTSVVIATGGSGTIVWALTLGIPMVVIPTAWDQPENGWRVQEAGVGIRLSPGRCTPATLRHAVQRVLEEPAFRENAHRLAVEMGRHGGPDRAVELLERLIQDRSVVDVT